MGRAELARLLFSDAEDPLGALRWSLSELRRAVGQPDAFRGGLLAVDEDRIVVDARVVDRGGVAAGPLSEQAGELLEGVEPYGCPEFGTWLAIARHRLRTRTEDHLRDGAMRALAVGDTGAAVRLAGLAVAANQYDQPLHELLVRSLARHGDVAAAREHVRRAERLLAEGSGVGARVGAPSPTLRAAATEGPADRVRQEPVWLASVAVVESLLASGLAAVGAGAVDAGVDTLRQAAAAADDRLRGRVLLALGGALVHGARGRDEEGAVVLHEALLAATTAGDRATTSRCLRELAFVDVQAGRVGGVDLRLREALRLSGDDDELVAAVLGVMGMHRCDRGDLVGSLQPLSESVERATRARHPRQAAWSYGLLGRSWLLLGEPARALATSRTSVSLCRGERWQAFLPFPLAIGAEAAMAEGAPADAVEDDLRAAFALGCQLGDPCWEGAAARGLALVSAHHGDLAAARDTVADGYARSAKHPDGYVFVQAWVLAADVALARADDDEDGERASRAQLEALALRSEQPWFLTGQATTTGVPLPRSSPP